MTLTCFYVCPLNDMVKLCGWFRLMISNTKKLIPLILNNNVKFICIKLKLGSEECRKGDQRYLWKAESIRRESSGRLLGSFAGGVEERKNNFEWENGYRLALFTSLCRLWVHVNRNYISSEVPFWSSGSAGWINGL